MGGDGTVPGRRLALIVANWEYTDPKLSALRAPSQDARALAGVLRNPAVGNFAVKTMLNKPAQSVRRAVQEFFTRVGPDNKVGPDDLLLLYFSCHGIKDDGGRLFLATRDTDIGLPDSTAVEASFISGLMDRSRSRRIVLLLDCCYSGAFARGLVPRGDDQVHVIDHFEGSGRGRAVLTASTATEYSFEGDERSGRGQSSVFTTALVQGLKTGEADRDCDSYISVDELYSYVSDKVAEVTPSQTPNKWVFNVEGDLIIARSNRPREAGGGGPGPGATTGAPAGGPIGGPSGPGPVLEVSQSRIEISGVGWDEVLADECIDVCNTGGGTLDWTVEADAPWIEVARQPGGFRVRLRPSPGVNRGNIHVRDRGRGGSRKIPVVVEMRPRLSPPPPPYTPSSPSPSPSYADLGRTNPWARPAPAGPATPPRPPDRDTGERSSPVALLLGTTAVVVVLVVAVFLVLALQGRVGGGSPGTDPSTSVVSSVRTTLATGPPATGTFVPPTSPPLPGEVGLTLSRASGKAGTTLTVSGSGFTAGETVVIMFHTEQVGKAQAGPKGTFGPVSVQVPPTWPFKGQFFFIASGRTSIESAREPFQVT